MVEGSDSQPAYSWLTDTVRMPILGAFERSEEYYCSMFHELVHSTGHSSRLDRAEVMSARFGTDKYAMEELLAEMGAALLCSEAGIVDVTLDNSAAYLASWGRRFRADPKVFFRAAAGAQQAVDLILGAKVRVEEAA